jgi:Actinobacteria/chloroflexi VLRF1 release factor
VPGGRPAAKLQVLIVRKYLKHLLNEDREAAVPPRGPDPGRWIDVAPERLHRWVESFVARHGEVAAEADPEGAVLRAADGVSAQCQPPFPPLIPAAAGGGGTAAALALADLVAAHATADRTVGVVLVRLGGYAAGVFAGSPPALVTSKTGSRLVHGRSAAGGWSQQRFARRREKQAASALAAAAETAAAVLGRYPGRLDAVVLGGDRRAVAGLRDDPRLRPYLGLAVARFLTVPDPKLAVLRDSPRLFRAIRIRVSSPG